MSGNSIKVVCRFRPQNSLEIREGGTPIIGIDDDGTVCQLKASLKPFFFETHLKVTTSSSRFIGLYILIAFFSFVIYLIKTGKRFPGQFRF